MPGEFFDAAVSAVKEGTLLAATWTNEDGLIVDWEVADKDKTIEDNGRSAQLSERRHETIHFHGMLSEIEIDNLGVNS